MNYTHNPSVFDPSSFADAIGIILTASDGVDSDERWVNETPYEAGLIVDKLALSESSLVLDYGCGVGRLAKELIGRVGCRVVGVDPSANMRALAAHYVNSNRFVVCAPACVDMFAFDAALCVWVLQHCPTPEVDIAAIHGALKPAAPLLVINGQKRFLPALDAKREHVWIDDGIDIAKLLSDRFGEPETRGLLDSEFVHQTYACESYWSLFRK